MAGLLGAGHTQTSSSPHSQNHGHTHTHTCPDTPPKSHPPRGPLSSPRGPAAHTAAISLLPAPGGEGGGQQPDRGRPGRAGAAKEAPPFPNLVPGAPSKRAAKPPAARSARLSPGQGQRRERRERKRQEQRNGRRTQREKVAPREPKGKKKEERDQRENDEMACVGKSRRGASSSETQPPATSCSVRRGLARQGGGAAKSTNTPRYLLPFSCKPGCEPLCPGKHNSAPNHHAPCGPARLLFLLEADPT